MGDFNSKPCPACGQHKVIISIELKASPLGTHSLSGSQMKVSASEVPVLNCGACDLMLEGEIRDDGAAYFWYALPQ